MTDAATHPLSCRNSQKSLRSAGEQPSSATVNPSLIPPAPASSHQPDNSIFLSHHSSSSLQLQHAERGDKRHKKSGSCWSGVMVTVIRSRNNQACCSEHEAPILPNHRPEACQLRHRIPTRASCRSSPIATGTTCSKHKLTEEMVGGVQLAAAAPK